MTTGSTGRSLASAAPDRAALRIRHKPFEGARELALRSADRLGCASLQEFTKWMSLPEVAVFDPPSIARLATFAGADRQELEQWSHRPTDRHGIVQYRDTTISIVKVRSRWRRFCPMCLQDDLRRLEPDEPRSNGPYHRSWWSISIFYACPEHRCAMIERCPGCGESIGRDSLPMHRHDCGAWLWDAEAVPLDEAAMAGSDYLTGRIGIGERIPCATLDAVGLAQAFSVMSRLGASAVFGIDAGNVGVRDERNERPDMVPSQLGLIVSRGLECCRDGSRSIEVLLDDLASQAQPGRRASMSSLYGRPFGAWLGSHFNPIRKVIDEVLREHLRRNDPLKRPSYGDHGQHPSYRIYTRIPLTVPERLRFERILPSALPERGWRQDAKNVGRAAGALLAATEAAPYIGLSHTFFSRMVGARFVMPVWYSERHHVKYFYRVELDEWLDWIEAKLVPPTEDLEWTDVFDAAVRWSRRPFHCLIDRIIHGELRATRSTAGRLQISDLLVARADLPKAAPWRCGAQLDQFDLARAIGVSPTTARHLIAQGLIPSSRWRRENFVADADAHAFSQQYATLKDLAAIHPLHNGLRGIRWVLRDSGLEPLLPSKYTRLFPRPEAITAVLAYCLERSAV